MTHRGDIAPLTPALSPPRGEGVVLSVFSGIDLLGMAFKQEGCCVVSAMDIMFGHDIRDFDATALRGHVTGVIGGPPCQDFSKARRTPATGRGLEMLHQFERVVTEANPEWFLCENVPAVPDVTVPGFRVQRVDLDARECGCEQRRARHFQFGSRLGKCICVPRQAVTELGHNPCLASEGRRGGRKWAEFCALQNLPPGFALPDFTKAGKFKAVGNGVPLLMGRVLARAIAGAIEWHATKFGLQFCQCGCGRMVTPPQVLAEARCRKRQQRRRDAAGVTARAVTVDWFA